MTAMINGLMRISGVLALMVLGLTSDACSRGGKGTAGSADSGLRVGSPDCYQTAGAAPCPPDPTDPSGRKLPTPGGSCTLAPCKTCGSATVPSFRDATGAPQAGWCFCVPKSDDSGLGIYTCRVPAEWPQPR